MMATSFLIYSFLWAKRNFTSQVLLLSLSLLCKPYSLLRSNPEYESSSELYSRSSFHSLDNHIHFHLLNFHQWYYMPMPTKSLYSSLTHMICLKPTYSNIYSHCHWMLFGKYEINMARKWIPSFGHSC